ncbi:MAG: sugar phosphate isomerase/epimerase [Candidatus Eremiobacteraeota bacterium]|nr:sugar phosphate isomerase/epimerase [Candidatus Eremiobacteraeota bacterium]
MKLAYTVVTPELPRFPLGWAGDPDEILPALGKMGYDGVELQVREPSAFDGAEYRRKAEAAGLKICAVSTGGIGAAENMFLTSPDADMRRRAIARYKTVLDLSASYGVDASIGRFRGLLGWAPDRETGMGWFRSALEELLPYAERLGIRIVLEPQHAYNVDCLHTFDETLAFIDSFETRSLVFEADIHHQGLTEKSIPGALVKGYLSGKMTFVQVSDSNRLPPGLGIFHWPDVFETLRAVGYDGWISVECRQFPDSRRCAEQTHAFLRRLIDAPPLS